MVTFQAQNRETVSSTWKVAVSFKIIMTTSVTRPVFHNTTSDLQDQDQDHSVQDQDQDRFLGLRLVRPFS